MSGTRVAETILASVHMRARQQAGHMDASDLIKSMQRQSCKEGAVHIWGPDADRRAKLLICQAVKGSLFDAYSQVELLGSAVETAALGDGDESAQQFQIEHAIDLGSRSIILENIVSIINIADLPSA